MDHFVGLDVSVKETSVCIVDDTGRIVKEVKAASEPQALLKVLGPRQWASLERGAGCPRWGSKPEILAACRCFPLYPQDRTSLNAVGMSVSCHNRASQRSTALRFLDLPSVSESSDVIHSAKARTARRCRLARGKTR